MSSALWSQEKPSGGFRDDWRFYMVIKECTVEKPSQKTLRIPRGSLGQACQERNSLGRTLTPCKGKKSLRILDQTNVVLSLDERDVLELDENLAELLFPITNCEERYALLCNKSRLDRVRDIDCGSKVRVQLRSGDEPLPGVVRFKGSLLPDRALAGIWFGVELLVRLHFIFHSLLSSPLPTYYLLISIIAFFPPKKLKQKTQQRILLNIRIRGLVVSAIASWQEFYM